MKGLKKWQTLSPRHRLNAVAIFEEPGEFRLSVESLFVSKQRLPDGATGKSYVMFGALVEKMFPHFSLFLAGENLADVR